MLASERRSASERPGVQTTYASGLSYFEPLDGHDMRFVFNIRRGEHLIEHHELIIPRSAVLLALPEVAKSFGYALVSMVFGRKH